MNSIWELPNSAGCITVYSLGQTLCILANIADGNTAKDLIMTNDDMLQKIKYYMVRPPPGNRAPL